MYAYSNTYMNLGRDPIYYPMAENVPFTRVVKDQPGDPLYVDPIMQSPINDYLRTGALKIADLVDHLAKQAQEQGTFEESIPNYLKTSNIVIISCALGVGISLIHTLTASKVDKVASCFVIGLGSLGLYYLLSPKPAFYNAMYKTASSIREFYRTPMPACDMKLTDAAVKSIKENRRMPPELDDVLKMEGIKDPVTFLDKTGSDTTMTIFERSSALELVNKNLDHPLSRRKISYEEIVELPVLKRQISELTQELGLNHQA